MNVRLSRLLAAYILSATTLSLDITVPRKHCSLQLGYAPVVGYSSTPTYRPGDYGITALLATPFGTKFIDANHSLKAIGVPLEIVYRVCKPRNKSEPLDVEILDAFPVRTGL